MFKLFSLSTKCEIPPFLFDQPKTTSARIILSEEYEGKLQGIMVLLLLQLKYSMLVLGSLFLEMLIRFIKLTSLFYLSSQILGRLQKVILQNQQILELFVDQDRWMVWFMSLKFAMITYHTSKLVIGLLVKKRGKYLK